MKRFLFSIAMACLSFTAIAQNASQQERMQAMMRNMSRTEVKTIQSKVLGAERQYTIFLPEGYASNTEKYYPVLYLLHGMNGTHEDWAGRGHLKDVMDQLKAAGEVCEMIVVMPNAGGNIGEGVWNGYFNMDGWAYERFFYEELVPTVEKEYRIKADKAHRALAGLSMGGGGSTSYAQRHADMFCACYAMSALMHLPKPDEVAPAEQTKMWHLTKAANQYSCVDYINNADEATKEALRSIKWYIDIGDDDFLFDCNVDFIMAMRKAEIPYQFRVRDGGHTWEYWHSALYEALPFVTRAFGE